MSQHAEMAEMAEIGGSRGLDSGNALGRQVRATVTSDTEGSCDANSQSDLPTWDTLFVLASCPLSVRANTISLAAGAALGEKGRNNPLTAGHFLEPTVCVHCKYYFFLLLFLLLSYGVLLVPTKRCT